MLRATVRPHRRGLRPLRPARAASTTPPRPGSRPSRSRRSSTRSPTTTTRTSAPAPSLIKEQRSELVKHHLWVLWTDYFKPPHFEKYPQLHTLVNEATKLAGATGTKGSSTPARPTSCSPRSTRSPRSSGRPRRPDCGQVPGPAALRAGAGFGARPWAVPAGTAVSRPRLTCCSARSTLMGSQQVPDGGIQRTAPCCASRLRTADVGGSSCLPAEPRHPHGVGNRGS